LSIPGSGLGMRHFETGNGMFSAENKKFWVENGIFPA
jgi:hypothetical protein